jgi:hypothetical protein
MQTRGAVAVYRVLMVSSVERRRVAECAAPIGRRWVWWMPGCIWTAAVWVQNVGSCVVLSCTAFSRLDTGASWRTPTGDSGRGSAARVMGQWLLGLQDTTTTEASCKTRIRWYAVAPCSINALLVLKLRCAASFFAA